MTTAPAPTRRTTRSTRRPVAATAAALAVLLSLGACSSSGNGADAATTSTTAAPSTTEAEVTTTTEADEEETETEEATEHEGHEEETETEDSGYDGIDEGSDGTIDEAELDDANDRVQRINLTIDDLPEGWVAEAPIDEVTSVVTECTEYGADENVAAKAASDRFSLIVDQGGLGLDTTSGYLESVETAEMLMGELASTDFADCATEQLLSAEGVTVEGQLNQFDGMPELGDEVVALQGDFAMSDTSGASVQLSAIIVAIRTDQVITTVSATAVDTPGDEQLLYQVLDLVAERQQG